MSEPHTAGKARRIDARPDRYCPAWIGAALAEIDTPCLLVDLARFERNVARMAQFVREHEVRLRAHAKTHKSLDIAAIQIAAGAIGVCCQKVSEAEAMVAGGIDNVLVSNEIVAPGMIDRLARLARRTRIGVCVDDLDNIAALDAAACRHGARLDVLVEIDVGAHRCGVAPGKAAVALAGRIAASPNLAFAGLQAYHGPAQHVHDRRERQRIADRVIEQTRDTVRLLGRAGLVCRTVAGAGTGSYPAEAASGVFNELQCGSYIFMDAAYGAIERADLPFEHSLFVHTRVMSKTRAGQAVCDAGHKSHSLDSGLPLVAGRTDVRYVGASDEHGQLDDPRDTLGCGDTLQLIPGHCDPTVNLHDWLVGVRHGHVETLWPITARGMVF